MSTSLFSPPAKSVSAPFSRVFCRNSRWLPLLAALWAAAGTARAGTLLLSNAIVHTVSGGTLTNAAVLVREGRIAEVGPGIGSADATVVDLKGQHLYPGMIALDSGLGLIEIEAARATIDTAETGDYHPDIESWVAVNPDSELIPVTRANGITHAEPAPQGGVVAGLSGVIALDGWTVEQMTVKRAAALHVYWPEATLMLGSREGRGGGLGPRRARGEAGEAGGPKSPEEQARDRAAKIRELDDFFQEARAYARARAAGRVELNPPWEAMLPVVAGEVPLVVHADDVRQIKSAVAWAGTNGLRIAIAGGRDAAMVAGLLAEKKIPVIFEHVFTLPRGIEHPYDLYFRAPGVLHAAGVKVVFSMGAAGMSAAHGRNLPYLAAQAAAFGLPEDEALKGVTLYAAEVVGVADRLGSIEPGKEASLVLADGSLLDERTQVKRMWIAGREVDLSSRHTRLYQKYQGRPKPGAK